MKKTKQLLLMIAALSFMAAACTDSLTKNEYISNYEGWVSKLKTEYKTYKKRDWSKAEDDFKRYGEGEYNRFKAQFTNEERDRVDHLTGQYYALLAKYKTNQVKSELKSLFRKAQSMFEELKKE